MFVVDNRIHPTAVLEGDIALGTGNVIGPFSVLVGPISIADDNRIGPHASIGGAADELKHRPDEGEGGSIEIGSRCLVRDFVSIHKPFHGETTLLGDDAYLMHGSYVAHDTEVQSKGTLAQAAAIGGLSKVMEGAYVAIGAAVQQRTVIGPYSIVAATAAAVRCVRPFSRFIPGKPVEVNRYAIERHGFSEHAAEIERYVLEGAPAESPAIRTLVESYERARDASGVPEYP